MLAQLLRKSLTVVFVLADSTNTSGVNKARASGSQGNPSGSTLFRFSVSAIRQYLYASRLLRLFSRLLARPSSSS
jgi:hypothetical protein